MSDALDIQDEQEGPEPEGYDAWFRREVEIGLREADDPNAIWYTMEESNERMHLLKSAHAQLQKAS